MKKKKSKWPVLSSGFVFVFLVNAEPFAFYPGGVSVVGVVFPFFAFCSVSRVSVLFVLSHLPEVF